ncbi:MAG: Xaa-Pro aminopeptidase [Spirochaetia bacterium]|jgi:Xaa-Pro aminopeptidase|nr:Xaa-Pro aminopeptidase [Spirochaetia bacterium]
MFEPTVYRRRRERLCALLREKGMRGFVLLSAHSQSPINYPSNSYRFRQDSNWLYFIGLNEPDMAVLIDIEDGLTRLFADELSMDDLIWTGPRPSLAEQASAAGIFEILPLASMTGAVQQRFGPLNLSAIQKDVLIPPICRLETKAWLESLLGLPRGALEGGDCEALIASIIAMREIKEEREIAEIEKAVEVSAEMHRSLIESLRPGWTESEAAALVRYIAERRGCGLSFATIATQNGEVLHNRVSEAPCSEGSIFLLDAGAEGPSGYAGDLTSSFPVGRAFSPRQADLYGLLCRVFEGATASLEPGKKFLEVHKTASKFLVQGLKELGIMKGDPDEAVEAGAHALFFPHGIGHMMGLDVHDMEGLGEDRVGYAGESRSVQFGLRSLRLAKALKPGMVHSVEPGIYFIPGLIDKWQAEALHDSFIDYEKLNPWRGCGGLRLEEDWLMTQKGPRRLGPVFDRSLKALENARRDI